MLLVWGLPLFVNFNKQEEQTEDIALDDIEVSFEN